MTILYIYLAVSFLFTALFLAVVMSNRSND